MNANLELPESGASHPAQGRTEGVKAFNLLVYAAVALALLFVVYQWFYSGGYPYIKDGNESALSFVHALNLYIFNPWVTRFLTSCDTEFNKVATTASQLYTHNPNFPRYVHYVLLLTGIKSFTTQVLLITVAVTILNVLSLRWLLTAALGRKAQALWLALFAIFATLTDYIGFLAYTVNTYRTYCFCLLWLCLLSMIKPWPCWRIFILFFILFQLEYGYAIFVLGASLMLLVVNRSPRWIRTAIAAISGTCASLLLFFLQLITYDQFPLKYIVAEFTRTKNRRGGTTFLTYFTDTLPSLYSKLREIQLPAQNYILLWALITSIAILIHYRLGSRKTDAMSQARLSLARIFISLIGGAIASSVILTDYFVDAFFGSLLPFLTFFNVTAMTMVAADLFVLMALLPKRWLSLRVAAGACIVVLVFSPLVKTSLAWWHRYPGLTGGYVGVLKKHYFKKPIMVMGHFNQDPTALTWGPTLEMDGREPDPATADYSRFDKYRDEKGELTFLCLDLEWVGMDRLLPRMEARGDIVEYRGRDYALVRIKKH